MHKAKSLFWEALIWESNFDNLTILQWKIVFGTIMHLNEVEVHVCKSTNTRNPYTVAVTLTVVGHKLHKHVSYL